MEQLERNEASNQFEKELMKALGLENVRSTRIEVILDAWQPPQVRVYTKPQSEQEIDLSSLPKLIEVMSESHHSRRLPGLTEGRIVHYVLPDGQSKGEHRPAIIVNVWGDDGISNLTVFTDHENDYDHNKSNVHQESGNTNLTDGFYGTMWATSVVYDEKKSPGTWHWIEKA